MNPLLETWRMHQQKRLDLLAALPEAALPIIIFEHGRSIADVGARRV